MTALPRNLTPDPSLILAACEARLDYRTALSEWIDNAFDANATTVQIELGVKRRGAPAYLLVEDNGEGCEDLAIIATLGARRQQPRKTLGRYGVGAKDAALWLGGADSTFSVRSRRSNIVRTLTVSWRDLVRRHSWELPIDCSDERVADAGDKHGTTLRVQPCVHRTPDGADWQRLLDELGYIYAPAIKRGRQIVVRRAGVAPQTIARWEPPPFEGAPVCAELTVDGKRVDVFAGIVKADVPNPKPGLTYWHGYRVILPATAQGCGGRSIARVCGFVELGDGWVLTKNKDDISKDADRVFDAVHEAIQFLLERAEGQAHSLKLDALVRDVSAEINKQAFGAVDGELDAKAERDKGNKTGTVEPKNGGKKHSRAARTQPGRTFASSRRVSRYRVEFVELGTDETVGRYDDSGRVVLNTSHPKVAEYRSRASVDAIAQLALSIIANASTVHEQLGLLDHVGGQVDRFCRAFAALTKGSVRFDGQENGTARKPAKDPAAE